MNLSTLSSEQHRAIQAINLVVFDVDGVMTNGSLTFLPDGQEVKTFHVLDGLGIKMLHQVGIKTAIITGRRSAQVEQRAQSLNITHVVQNREDKLQALEELWAQIGASAETTAYMGDDLPDLQALQTVAFSGAPPNAHPVVLQNVHWCSKKCGGAGAVREFCEVILTEQGKLDNLLKIYYLENP